MKHEPGHAASLWRTARRRFLVEVDDENGNKKRVVARRWVCPSCGKPIVDKNGAPINVPGSSKLMTCDGKFGREIAELDRKECGLDRSQHRKQLAEIPAGRVIETHGKRWRVCACKEPLWQFTDKPKRWPPAVFIAKKMPKAFTYLIIDELHEQKSDSSGQATACGKLISSTRYCLGMTGTLIGGYANHLFPLLFRMSAERLREEGFEWAKDLAFTERYGRIERIVTTKESAGELTLTTSNRSMRRDRSGRSERRRPVPGVMPALFGRHLIDKAIFLALEDMADNLPKLREYVGGPPQPDYDDDDHRFHIDCRVSMAPEQAAGIQAGRGHPGRHLPRAASAWQHEAARGDAGHAPRVSRPAVGLDGSHGQAGPSRGRLLEDGQQDRERLGGGRAASVARPRTIVYPKEQALLDICRREVQAGNQVWVYCQMTGKRDIQPRLKQILAEAGFRVAIMRSRSVKTRDRLDWIEKEGKKSDIVISHPQLVQTGLDFFGKKPGSHNFNAIAFYETGYNPFTMQQAARRAWRIGQSKDCRVYYLHYRDTMQQRAMALMARKMAAMMALDGRLSVEGLAGMADDESAAMALARSISDAIDSADIQRNWVKVASNRRPASSPLISFGQALLEDEPIDGLDILAIEPHLIAQTILDTQDEAGEFPISRDVLARMLDDFDSISDEELEMAWAYSRPAR